MPTPVMPLSEPLDHSRHQEYYWGCIKFKVGDTLLRLRKRPFVTESDEFPRLYGLSVKDDTEDTEIIELSDVSLRDFESFLKGLLPESSFYKERLQLTREEWIAVLRLSSKWLFNDLRNVAIAELTKDGAISAIKRVCLAKEYNVSPWLLSGYERLVERQQRFTDDEAKQIGWTVALTLSGIIIDRLRVTHSLELEHHILEEFGAEFKAMKGVERKYLIKEERARIEAEEEAERDSRRLKEEEAEKERLERQERERKKREEQRARKRKAEEERRRTAEEEARRKSEEERERKLREEEERKKAEEEAFRIAEEEYQRNEEKLSTIREEKARLAAEEERLIAETAEQARVHQAEKEERERAMRRMEEEEEDRAKTELEERERQEKLAHEKAEEKRKDKSESNPPGFSFVGGSIFGSSSTAPFGVVKQEESNGWGFSSAKKPEPPTSGFGWGRGSAFGLDATLANTTVLTPPISKPETTLPEVEAIPVEPTEDVDGLGGDPAESKVTRKKKKKGRKSMMSSQSEPTRAPSPQPPPDPVAYPPVDDNPEDDAWVLAAQPSRGPTPPLAVAADT